LTDPAGVSVDDLLDLHDQVIASPDGAAPGLRDLGALEAAVARPTSGFGGLVFYPTPFARAAALMESVIQRHPFVDGNKRTGLLAAAFLLEEEGYEVEASQQQLADVAVEVADHHLDVDGLARWLEGHAAQSGPS
jgi:death on curing protein